MLAKLLYVEIFQAMFFVLILQIKEDHYPQMSVVKTLQAFKFYFWEKSDF